jgi:hypothetical protein
MQVIFLKEDRERIEETVTIGGKAEIKDAAGFPIWRLFLLMKGDVARTEEAS